MVPDDFLLESHGNVGLPEHFLDAGHELWPDAVSRYQGDGLVSGRRGHPTRAVSLYYTVSIFNTTDRPDCQVTLKADNTRR